MYVVRTLTVALALLSQLALAQSLRLKPTIQVADNTNRFTAQFVIDLFPVLVPTTYYKVETSTDLENWQNHYFRYNADSQQIAQSDYSIISVAEGVSIPEVLAIDISLAPEEKTFLRLTQLEEAPATQRFLTRETVNLLANLHRIGWDPDSFAFGQEFPLSYREGIGSGDGQIEKSDSKDVVGDHPGVHGSDFDYMLDRSWEEDFHIAAARRAYEDGAIVTFDWHWGGKYGGTYSAQVDDNKILDHVVRDDDSRGDVTWFYESIDRVLDRINNDLQFPIVFRPFHEMDGNWFWWGRQIDGGAETYQRAYQLLVEYMSARTEYVLFCWSPDVATTDFEQFYPGDAYVDVCGRDIYSVGNSGRPLSKLTEMIAFAEEHGKVAVFSETGYTAGGASFETGDPDWWTTRILDPIKADPEAGKIAWVLTWINATWSGPYIPHSSSPQAAKDDFQTFHDEPATLFQEDVAALNVYDSPPTE
ncbi:Glycosyl hydrolase family 26 [Verrucomicrobiia bacterium DG1235]|nr:Glycosyl hydrolase family 26 [Verrucomicrobiae bacterium DG1235]